MKKVTIRPGWFNFQSLFTLSLKTGANFTRTYCEKLSQTESVLQVYKILPAAKISGLSKMKYNFLLTLLGRPF